MVLARTEHFGSLLEDGLDEIFHNTWDEFPSLIPELFNVQTTDRPYVKDQAIGGFKYFRKFDGTVNYDRNHEQYETTYEFPEYAEGFKVERKLFDDDMYNIINQRPLGLAEAARRTREKHASSIFNNAFDANYVGGDGKPLCATDHPSKSPDGPPERKNKGTKELSHDSLWDTVLEMRKTMDDRGNNVPVSPSLLLVPDALHETAWKLVKSDQVINQSDENPNILQGRFKLVTWRELEDPEAWFLIDEKYMKMFLKWYDRIPIEFAWEEDFDTLVAKYRAYMRYEAGFSSWEWIYGHKPSE